MSSNNNKKQDYLVSEVEKVKKIINRNLDYLGKLLIELEQLANLEDEQITEK